MGPDGTEPAITLYGLIKHEENLKVFFVVTAGTVNIAVFEDVTSCSLVDW